MEPYDISTWRNLGVAVAFQPFDWQLGIDQHPGDIQISFGPFTVSVGWPVF